MGGGGGVLRRLAKSGMVEKVGFNIRQFWCAFKNSNSLQTLQDGGLYPLNPNPPFPLKFTHSV